MGKREGVGNTGRTGWWAVRTGGWGTFGPTVRSDLLTTVESVKAWFIPVVSVVLLLAHTQTCTHAHTHTHTNLCSSHSAQWVNLAIVSAFHWTLSLHRRKYIFSLSYDKCTYCKSLWIKVPAKCPSFKCKCKRPVYKLAYNSMHRKSTTQICPTPTYLTSWTTSSLNPHSHA